MTEVDVTPNRNNGNKEKEKKKKRAEDNDRSDHRAFVSAWHGLMGAVAYHYGMDCWAKEKLDGSYYARFG